MTTIDDSWYDDLLTDATETAPPDLRAAVSALAIDDQPLDATPSDHPRRRWLLPVTVAAAIVAAIAGIVLTNRHDTPTISPADTVGLTVAPPETTQPAGTQSTTSSSMSSATSTTVQSSAEDEVGKPLADLRTNDWPVPSALPDGFQRIVAHRVTTPPGVQKEQAAHTLVYERPDGARIWVHSVYLVNGAGEQPDDEWYWQWVVEQGERRTGNDGLVWYAALDWWGGLAPVSYVSTEVNGLLVTVGGTASIDDLRSGVVDSLRAIPDDAISFPFLSSPATEDRQATQFNEIGTVSWQGDNVTYYADAVDDNYFCWYSSLDPDPTTACQTPKESLPPERPLRLLHPRGTVEAESYPRTWISHAGIAELEFTTSDGTTLHPTRATTSGRAGGYEAVLWTLETDAWPETVTATWADGSQGALAYSQGFGQGGPSVVSPPAHWAPTTTGEPIDGSGVPGDAESDPARADPMWLFAWQDGFISGIPGPATGPDRYLDLAQSEDGDDWSPLRVPLPDEIGTGFSATVVSDRLVLASGHLDETPYRLTIASTTDLENWTVAEILAPGGAGTAWIAVTDSAWTTEVATVGEPQYWAASWTGQPMLSEITRTWLSTNISLGNRFIAELSGDIHVSRSGIDWTPIEMPLELERDLELNASLDQNAIVMPTEDGTVVISSDGVTASTWLFDADGTWRRYEIPGLPYWLERQAGSTDRVFSANPSTAEIVRAPLGTGVLAIGTNGTDWIVEAIPSAFDGGVAATNGNTMLVASREGDWMRFEFP